MRQVLLNTANTMLLREEQRVKAEKRRIRNLAKQGKAVGGLWGKLKAKVKEDAGHGANRWEKLLGEAAKEGEGKDPDEVSSASLNAPCYLFVSYPLAVHYPTLLEGGMVRTFFTPLPGEEGKRWREMLDKAGYEGDYEEHDAMGGYRFDHDNAVAENGSSPNLLMALGTYIVYFPLTLMASFARHLVLAFPLWMQSLFIRIFEPVFFSSLLFFFLLIRDSPIYIGLVVLSLLLGAVSMVRGHMKAVEKGGTPEGLESDVGIGAPVSGLPTPVPTPVAVAPTPISPAPRRKAVARIWVVEDDDEAGGSAKASKDEETRGAESLISKLAAASSGNDAVSKGSSDESKSKSRVWGVVSSSDMDKISVGSSDSDSSSEDSSGSAFSSDSEFSESSSDEEKSDDKVSSRERGSSSDDSTDESDIEDIDELEDSAEGLVIASITISDKTPPPPSPLSSSSDSSTELHILFSEFNSGSESDAESGASEGEGAGGGAGGTGTAGTGSSDVDDDGDISDEELRAIFK